MLVSKEEYNQIKANEIEGRYVTNNQISAFLEKCYDKGLVETIGYSVEKRPIQSITIGKGTQKILMWSQMHGNESTTTKAVLDLLIYLTTDSIEVSEVLSQCTIKIIPMLNPDGAQAYTRVNANAIDLNRDAQDRTQPESNVLRTIFEDFEPQYCFNLHDQRTIFNVGNSNKPATVSFLAPAHDEERSISSSRLVSMQLIVAMNVALQNKIPGQVGRYDDAFNANCVGDTFQMLETPTVLFEAGHYQEDYEREKTREYIFHALVAALDGICSGKIQNYSKEDYFSIPENRKRFFDVLVKNAHKIHSEQEQDIGIVFQEVLRDSKILFEPRIDKKGKLTEYFGHKTFDCENSEHLNRLKKSDVWHLVTS